MSAAARRITNAAAPAIAPAVWDKLGKLTFNLNDLLDHPFYFWPKTLLGYPVEFQSSVDLDRLVLTRTDTDERVPIQFSDVVRGEHGVRTATLNFFSDLPSGGHREFVLSAGDTPTAVQPQVKESIENGTIVLDSGVMRVRIPASQAVAGEAPGPIMQVSRGSSWVGSSTLTATGPRVTQITSKRVANGPLFIAYELTYAFEDGSQYIAHVQCNAGMDFVRLREDMEGMKPGVHGLFTSNWNGFDVTHRQAPNHPYPMSGRIRPYDNYPWETIGEPWVLHPETLPEDELSFNLGNYQTWTAFRTGTFANFWNKNSGDALGVFIDKADGWQDHEYTNHVESPTLEVRFYYQDGEFTWRWPIVRGSRSTCVAFYDHEKDKEAMHLLEQSAKGVQQDGVTYAAGLILGSHTHFLQNRYGTLDLNCVKDWVLEYPETSRRAPVIFSTGSVKDGDDLEKRVMAGPFVSTLPINGTRENGGAGPIPGRSIVNFSPVPSRQVQGWWVDGYSRWSATMNERQRKRVTAAYLFMAYVCAGDDFMPLVNMLSGHPNFLADVKGVPAAMSFLFPDHPMAARWADLWEKCVEINTRYSTRPDVKTWNARGGRWTENLGTYVWAYLRPSLRSDFLLRNFDGVERFISPQLAEMTDWLVNALSAPFEGETAEAYKALQTLDDGHEWGALAQGSGRRRVHPPQGAHAEERVPPRSMWYLGTCLQRFAPIEAEHAMWAARPANQDMETSLGGDNPWDAMYKSPENMGTNPHLRSRKYTGYGIVLRSAVDTPDEVSIHLQQIDQGPNYRWGLAGEGGCGVIYYFAAGKAYSYNGAEDVGDRNDEDTDFCTSFAVFKDGEFRSIGENVLSRPFYDLDAGQFAELVPRQEPGAYSAPEYKSRSLMMAGSDYVVLYDSVLHIQIGHRFSWFVRRGSELPTIKFVRGVTKEKESQRTEIQTDATTGVWFDGVGDSMAVVSHRKDIETNATHYGCRVTSADVDDYVFCNPDPVHFAEGMTLFEGTAGLIRTRKDKSEFALFHGSKIGVSGVTLSTTDSELGIGGTVVSGQALSGEYFAPAASRVKIAVAGPQEKLTFYIDGEAQTGTEDADGLVVDLKEGSHHWEFTSKMPVPLAPRILRTENHAGGARVIAAPVASATRYRFEISKDGGTSWTLLGAQAAPEFDVAGLDDGVKVHVRAVALNDEHESTPGDEYPVYVTKAPPPAPDGLRVSLSSGAAALSWGEVLGASEYRLYARAAGASKFSLLYRGLERTFVDKRPGIKAANVIPDDSAGPAPADLVEYCVAAVNGNGEGAKSRAANTDPGSWRNWDPMPGEGFRRDFVDESASASIKVAAQWPHYYPR